MNEFWWGVIVGVILMLWIDYYVLRKVRNTIRRII